LGQYPPICIFPEGGTTNGKYLMQFKRGAFASLRAVKPVVLRYVWSSLSVAWDVIPFLPLAIMMFSRFYTRCDVIELPTFVPNDYLFEQHANKGDDKWEVYAWAVRQCMAEASGLEMSEQPFRDKLHYETVLGFKKERKQPNKPE
jgi:lysophosphatidylcholine acyltransferase/lyso-PAF acetyltransferase